MDYKRKTSFEGEGVDRISELPDAIIVSILSFLPLRDAVATSVLSTRWAHSWKHIPNLDFDIKNVKTNFVLYGTLWDAKSCKRVEMVNSVLRSHKSPSLKLFRISFYVDESAHSQVAEWLRLVFPRGVEALDLDFKCRARVEMVLLEEILRESAMLRPSTLKTVGLRQMKVSGEGIELLLRSCPSLEELFIHSVELTSDIEVCGGKLKRLGIRFATPEKAVKVSAPNLTWLSVDRYIHKKLVLENVPQLVATNFALMSGIPYYACVLFSITSQLKYLCLTLQSPNLFLAKGIPEMPKLEKLWLSLEFYQEDERGVMPLTTAFLHAAPQLQEFNISQIGDYVWEDTHPHIVTNVGRGPHQHLRVFEFIGFCAELDEHIELVTYVAYNCIALKKIIVSCCIRCWRDEAQAAADCAKPQLQGKIPHPVQVTFPMVGLPVWFLRHDSSTPYVDIREYMI